MDRYELKPGVMDFNYDIVDPVCFTHGGEYRAGKRFSAQGGGGEHVEPRSVRICDLNVFQIAKG